MLRQLKGNTGSLSIGTAEIGIYCLNENEVVLIDSGDRPSPALFGMLEERSWRVKAIINTHLHEDHIANHEALVARYGCTVYAGEAEPEDAKLWGISPSWPLVLTKPDAAVAVGGAEFLTVFTPGHSLGHQLVATPDGVCFLGDAVMTVDALSRAKLPFRLELPGSLKSMERIRGLSFPLYCAAHKGVIRPEELSGTAAANERREEELLALLRRLRQEPEGEDGLSLRFMRALGITNPETLEKTYMKVSAQARIRAVRDRSSAVPH